MSATPQRDDHMPKPQMLLDLYLHLAKASEEQGRPLQQDKFLVLAARVAQKAGWIRVAEDCRRHILKHNPNHILKRFPSMAEALECDDIRQYIRQLMRIYPFEKAEYLLDKFRASGYSGKHGYSLSVKPKSEPNGANAPSPTKPAAPAPRKPQPSPVVAGPVNGDSGSSVVRPSLQKALAAPAVKARPVPVSVEPPAEPLPLEIPHLTPPLSISPWTFYSWLVFALSLGIAIGGAAVFYLNSPG